METTELFQSFIKKAKNILITTHIFPDADGIGSQIALAHALIKKGKNAICVNEKKLVKRYKYLDSKKLVLSYDEFNRNHKSFDIDLFIVVDANSLGRVGPKMNQLISRAKNLLYIDHHPCPRELAAIHCIDPSKAATGELIGELIQSIKVPLTKEMALPLYTAILIDTSSFRYPTVTGDTHRFIAELMDTGVQTAKAYNMIYGTKKLTHMQLLGTILSNAESNPTGNIAWLKVTENLLKKYKVSYEDTNAFVNHLLVLEKVKVAIMFRQHGKVVKVSMRSNGSVDVGLLGQALGGGGHNHSAATVIEGDFDEVVKDTLAKIELILNRK